MRITYFSDLHFEFGDTNQTPSGEVLVLAGDFTIKARNLDWLNNLDFEHVIYVLGNHEFYRGSIEKIYSETFKLLAPHVHMLNDSSVNINGVDFHGATLWTDYNKSNPIDMMTAENVMNDHKLIRFENGERRFNAGSALYLHNESIKFLKKSVKPGDIIVTHHAPSYQSVHAMYANSSFNYAFVSDLEDLITQLKPKLWFHGHVHTSFDYTIGDTNILCNPRGYKGYEENIEFDWNKTIEI